jgi:hypothetical protein
MGSGRSRLPAGKNIRRCPGKYHDSRCMETPSNQGIEFGTRGVIPNSAAVTMHRKYGDCKDHAVLLHQLLTVSDDHRQMNFT